MLALAQSSYHAPFHPLPPPVPTAEVSDVQTAEVSDVQTERASAAALTETVAAMTAVLESMLRTPVQHLKSGGIGVRELKRL